MMTKPGMVVAVRVRVRVGVSVGVRVGVYVLTPVHSAMGVFRFCGLGGEMSEKSAALLPIS